MEHTASTLEQIENQIRAAKMYDVDAMVRVSRGNYSNLIRPLELDASGLIVPHCMTADDAREIVYRTRFHPLGRRPLDGGNADGSYCRIPTEQYLAQANAQRFIMLQYPSDLPPSILQTRPVDEIPTVAPNLAPALAQPESI
ncbi:hypothetical protein MNBD_ALPHA05-2280 [hydrothermal vent metagenome]|uniref:Uncharacterized protein n=1 Tax=hydrothermal vent metagenome TaxID=652676 RepID=A0A3B0R9Y3_9ZZZZ